MPELLEMEDRSMIGGCSIYKLGPHGRLMAEQLMQQVLRAIRDDEEGLITSYHIDAEKEEPEEDDPEDPEDASGGAEFEASHEWDGITCTFRLSVSGRSFKFKTHHCSVRSLHPEMHVTLGMRSSMGRELTRRLGRLVLLAIQRSHYRASKVILSRPEMGHTICITARGPAHIRPLFQLCMEKCSQHVPASWVYDVLPPEATVPHITVAWRCTHHGNKEV